MLTNAVPVGFPIIDDLHSRRELVDAILADRFEFNGEMIAMPPGFDWTANPSSDIEWLILLHKFYYAVGLGREFQTTGDARYLDKWVELTNAWITQVAVDFLPGDVAGRRLQNWVSAWHFFADAPGLPAGFRQRFLESIESQANWLSHHLTPARNHRTLELLALFMVAVAFPEMKGAATWSRLSQEAIVENLRRDLHPDGVHCEQSTDYHHIVLRNAIYFRRLARMNDIAMPDEFDVLIRKALDFALHIHRPDGLIPSLSDGDSASFLGLLDQGYRLYGDETYLWAASQGRRGQTPADRLKAFPDGGYYIIRSGWGDAVPFADERYLVFDCGPLGEGNHGHFDLLSFELYGYGRPLIVDPGRYTYDESTAINWRVAFRGTASHNTVVVDGRNQTRYEFHKRKFKVRGPEPCFELLGFGSRDGFDFVRGRADSFEYDVVHEREIRLIGGNRLVVLDDLRSDSYHSYEQVFQLTPAAHHRVTQHGGTVTAPHMRISQHGAGTNCSIADGWVSPSYGVKIAAPVVRYRLSGTNVRFETHLELHR